MELSEAYVTGLLAELDVDIPRLRSELGQAKQRTLAVDAELSQLVRRLDVARVSREQSEECGRTATQVITEHNLRLSTLHQEIGTLKRRSEDLKTEMERVGAGAIQRRLRRDRAKLAVQMEDRENEINRLRAEVERQRQVVQEAEQTATAERDRERAVVRELDQLQAQLPSPYLYLRLFEQQMAHAHCRLFLEHDRKVWGNDVRAAIQIMVELHTALRIGKYRLDKNSDVVGGRATATAETVFAAVAIGDLGLAREVFELATDPTLFFHHIFQVFRVWCLGLYLQERHTDLRELLRLHQFAEGLRGGYAQAFIGLLTRDRVVAQRGLRAIARHEWEMWQDPRQVRGVGIVNVGAVAITRLLGERGLGAPEVGPTVPRELILAAVKLRSQV